jgi:polyisoprenoid-binding protein YceI
LDLAYLRVDVRSKELAILITAPLLFARAATLDLDPSRTKIDFILGAVLHTVRGTFQLKQGHLEFDPAAQSISGEVIVDATSGNSANDRRDRRMHEQVLESNRYPEIRFGPTKMTGTVSSANNSAVTVMGMFEIHGQRHEITIPMELRILGDDLTAHGSFVVPYVAWGMKDPSNFLLKLEKRVRIEITAKGRMKGL